MSIQRQIDRLAGAKTTLGNYLQQNGVAVPAGATLDEMALQLADVIEKQNKITAAGLLKGDGAGGISAAVPGTDYVAENELPNVTADDNGKYLRVIDGVWDAGEPDFFICTVTASGSSYTCDKTSAQILAAANAGKIPIAVYNNAVYFLAGGSQMFAKFTRLSIDISEVLTVTGTGTASFQTVTLQTVPSRSSIDAPNRVNLVDNVEYYLTNVGTVKFAFPAATKFECWMRITTTASGTITVTFPATVKYIGEAPVFGAGETWELSVKDGVVIAMKETA